MASKSLLLKCLHNRSCYNIVPKCYSSLNIINSKNLCYRINYNFLNGFSTCSVTQKNQQIISDKEKIVPEETRKLQKKIEEKLSIIDTEKNVNAVSKINDTISAEWTPIYRSHHIISARAFQRFKIFQTLLTISVIAPISIKCYVDGLIDIFPVYISIGGSTLACVMLYIVGNFFSRFIGIIYVSKKEDPKKTVRIARLNFWGNRVDEYVPIKNIIPLSESVDNFNRPYLKLEQYSDDSPSDRFNLTLRYGSVLEPEEFEHAFGILVDHNL